MEPAKVIPSKFKTSPDMLSVEAKLKSLKLTEEQLNELYMDVIENNIASATSREEKKSWADLKVKRKAKAMTKRLEEAFIEDFQLWLIGRSQYNVKTRINRQNYRPDPRMGILIDPPVEEEVTPWGNKPLTFIPGVGEYIEGPVLNRDHVIKVLTKLKATGPRNIEECWLYYKYIVRKVGIDGDVVNEKNLFSDFDYLSREIYYDAHPGALYPYLEADPDYVKGSADNPAPPMFDADLYRQIKETAVIHAREGLMAFPKSTYFTSLCPEDKILIMSMWRNTSRRAGLLYGRDAMGVLYYLAEEGGEDDESAGLPPLPVHEKERNRRETVALLREILDATTNLDTGVGVLRAEAIPRLQGIRANTEQLVVGGNAVRADLAGLNASLNNFSARFNVDGDAHVSLRGVARAAAVAGGLPPPPAPPGGAPPAPPGGPPPAPPGGGPAPPAPPGGGAPPAGGPPPGRGRSLERAPRPVKMARRLSAGGGLIAIRDVGPDDAAPVAGPRKGGREARILASPERPEELPKSAQPSPEVARRPGPEAPPVEEEVVIVDAPPGEEVVAAEPPPAPKAEEPEAPVPVKEIEIDDPYFPKEEVERLSKWIEENRKPTKEEEDYIWDYVRYLKDEKKFNDALFYTYEVLKRDPENKDFIYQHKDIQERKEIFGYQDILKKAIQDEDPDKSTQAFKGLWDVNKNLAQKYVDRLNELRERKGNNLIEIKEGTPQIDSKPIENKIGASFKSGYSPSQSEIERRKRLSESTQAIEKLREQLKETEKVEGDIQREEEQIEEILIEEIEEGQLQEKQADEAEVPLNPLLARAEQEENVQDLPAPEDIGKQEERKGFLRRSIDTLGNVVKMSPTLVQGVKKMLSNLSTSPTEHRLEHQKLIEEEKLLQSPGEETEEEEEEEIEPFIIDPSLDKVRGHEFWGSPQNWLTPDKFIEKKTNASRRFIKDLLRASAAGVELKTLKKEKEGVKIPDTYKKYVRHLIGESSIRASDVIFHNLHKEMSKEAKKKGLDFVDFLVESPNTPETENTAGYSREAVAKLIESKLLKFSPGPLKGEKEKSDIKKSYNDILLEQTGNILIETLRFMESDVGKDIIDLYESTGDRTDTENRMFFTTLVDLRHLTPWRHAPADEREKYENISKPFLDVTMEKIEETYMNLYKFMIQSFSSEGGKWFLDSKRETQSAIFFTQLFKAVNLLAYNTMFGGGDPENKKKGEAYRKTALLYLGRHLFSFLDRRDNNGNPIISDEVPDIPNGQRIRNIIQRYSERNEEKEEDVSDYRTIQKTIERNLASRMFFKDLTLPVPIVFNNATDDLQHLNLLREIYRDALFAPLNESRKNEKGFISRILGREIKAIYEGQTIVKDDPFFVDQLQKLDESIKNEVSKRFKPKNVIPVLEGIKKVPTQNIQSPKPNIFQYSNPPPPPRTVQVPARETDISHPSKTVRNKLAPTPTRMVPREETNTRYPVILPRQGERGKLPVNVVNTPIRNVAPPPVQEPDGYPLPDIEGIGPVAEPIRKEEAPPPNIEEPPPPQDKIDEFLNETIEFINILAKEEPTDELMDQLTTYIQRAKVEKLGLGKDQQTVLLFTLGMLQSYLDDRRKLMKSKNDAIMVTKLEQLAELSDAYAFVKPFVGGLYGNSEDEKGFVINHYLKKQADLSRRNTLISKIAMDQKRYNKAVVEGDTKAKRDILMVLSERKKQLNDIEMKLGPLEFGASAEILIVDKMASNSYEYKKTLLSIDTLEQKLKEDIPPFERNALQKALNKLQTKRFQLKEDSEKQEEMLEKEIKRVNKEENSLFSKIRPLLLKKIDSASKGKNVEELQLMIDQNLKELANLQKISSDMKTVLEMSRFNQNDFGSIDSENLSILWSSTAEKLNYQLQGDVSQYDPILESGNTSLHSSVIKLIEGLLVDYEQLKKHREGSEILKQQLESKRDEYLDKLFSVTGNLDLLEKSIFKTGRGPYTSATFKEYMKRLQPPLKSLSKRKAGEYEKGIPQEEKIEPPPKKNIFETNDEPINPAIIKAFAEELSKRPKVSNYEYVSNKKRRPLSPPPKKEESSPLTKRMEPLEEKKGIPPQKKRAIQSPETIKAAHLEKMIQGNMPAIPIDPNSVGFLTDSINDIIYHSQYFPEDVPDKDTLDALDFLVEHGTDNKTILTIMDLFLSRRNNNISSVSSALNKGGMKGPKYSMINTIINIYETAVDELKTRKSVIVPKQGKDAPIIEDTELYNKTLANLRAAGIKLPVNREESIRIFNQSVNEFYKIEGEKATPKTGVHIPGSIVFKDAANRFIRQYITGDYLNLSNQPIKVYLGKEEGRFPMLPAVSKTFASSNLANSDFKQSLLSNSHYEELYLNNAMAISYAVAFGNQNTPGMYSNIVNSLKSSLTYYSGQWLEVPKFKDMDLAGSMPSKEVIDRYIKIQESSIGAYNRKLESKDSFIIAVNELMNTDKYRKLFIKSSTRKEGGAFQFYCTMTAFSSMFDDLGTTVSSVYLQHIQKQLQKVNGPEKSKTISDILSNAMAHLDQLISYVEWGQRMISVFDLKELSTVKSSIIGPPGEYADIHKTLRTGQRVKTIPLTKMPAIVAATSSLYTAIMGLFIVSLDQFAGDIFNVYSKGLSRKITEKKSLPIQQKKGFTSPKSQMRRSRPTDKNLKDVNKWYMNEKEESESSEQSLDLPPAPPNRIDESPQYNEGQSPSPHHSPNPFPDMPQLPQNVAGNYPDVPLQIEDVSPPEESIFEDEEYTIPQNISGGESPFKVSSHPMEETQEEEEAEAEIELSGGSEYDHSLSGGSDYEREVDISNDTYNIETVDDPYDKVEENPAEKEIVGESPYQPAFDEGNNVVDTQKEEEESSDSILFVVEPEESSYEEEQSSGTLFLKEVEKRGLGYIPPRGKKTREEIEEINKKKDYKTIKKSEKAGKEDIRTGRLSKKTTPSYATRTNLTFSLLGERLRGRQPKEKKSSSNKDT